MPEAGRWSGTSGLTEESSYDYWPLAIHQDDALALPPLLLHKTALCAGQFASVFDSDDSVIVLNHPDIFEPENLLQRLDAVSGLGAVFGQDLLGDVVMPSA